MVRAGLESHIAQHETPDDAAAPGNDDVTMAAVDDVKETPRVTCEYDGCAATFSGQEELWKHVEKVSTWFHLYQWWTPGGPQALTQNSVPSLISGSRIGWDILNPELDPSSP